MGTQSVCVWVLQFCLGADSEEWAAALARAALVLWGWDQGHSSLPLLPMGGSSLDSLVTSCRTLAVRHCGPSFLSLALHPRSVCGFFH